MGAQKYLKDVESLIAKSPVVSFSSIQRVMKRKKKQAQYPKQLIRQLVQKGKVKQLARGYYTSRDDPSLVIFCLQPAYLGLQDAMSQHNLWEQETIPIVITTRKVRTGSRMVLGSRVLVRHVQPHYFFGWEYAGDKPYSDLEKTLIDMVHFKQKITPEALQEFRKRVEKNKLREYLKAYPPRVRKKVWNIVQ